MVLVVNVDFLACSVILVVIMFRTSTKTVTWPQRQRENKILRNDFKMYRTAQKEWYSFQVPTSSLSCGGDVHVVGYVAVYVFDISQPSLPTSFYSLLVSVSVFMALSTVFHSIHSPNNSLLSHSVFFQSYLYLIGPFSYISLCESLPQPWYNPLWLTGLKAPNN